MLHPRKKVRCEGAFEPSSGRIHGHAGPLNRFFANVEDYRTALRLPAKHDVSGSQCFKAFLDVARFFSLHQNGKDAAQVVLPHSKVPRMEQVIRKQALQAVGRVRYHGKLRNLRKRALLKHCCFPLRHSCHVILGWTVNLSSPAQMTDSGRVFLDRKMLLAIVEASRKTTRLVQPGPISHILDHTHSVSMTANILDPSSGHESRFASHYFQQVPKIFLAGTISFLWEHAAQKPGAVSMVLVVRSHLEVVLQNLLAFASFCFNSCRSIRAKTQTRMEAANHESCSSSSATFVAVCDYGRTAAKVYIFLLENRVARLHRSIPLPELSPYREFSLLVGFA